MSRSINQIENVFFSLIGVLHLDGMTLDGNTSFLFEVHIIQHLTFSHLDSLSILQQTIGQSRLTMVNMCNNTKVTDMFHRYILIYGAKI